VLLDGLREDSLDGGVEAALPTAAVRFSGSNDESRPDPRYIRAQRYSVVVAQSSSSPSAFNHYRGQRVPSNSGAMRISPAPCFLPIPIAEVVQVVVELSPNLLFWSVGHF
jgi:hypothetical protein